MARTLVLIPTSRFVDAAMQLEIGKLPPILIPLNGKPLLDSIIRQYKNIEGEVRYCLLVNEGKERIAEELRDERRDSVQVISVPLKDSLGEVIRFGLSQIPIDQYDTLFINFGDTLIEADLGVASNAIYYETLNESVRWTTFEESKGKITSISDKQEVKLGEPHHVVTGVFRITDLPKFCKALADSNESPNISHFYAALDRYLKHVPYRLIKVERWHDFGHVDNYYASKRRFPNTRHFNSVRIDEVRAVLHKESSNSKKLNDEIRWYQELPMSLRCYIPQIFAHETVGDRSTVEMEYYGYPTLNDLFVFGGHDIGIWSGVFDAIFRLLDEMREYRSPKGAFIPVDEMYKMYALKTRARLNSLREHPLWNPFFTLGVWINGKQYRPLDDYLNSVDSLFEKLIRSNGGELSVIHGDFCLSNILYDPRNRIIKLVDPRGSFGDSSLFGDYRYDLAKLSHSFNGGYDLICSNRFTLFLQDRLITYNLRTSEEQRLITAMFNKRLSNKYSKEMEVIEFIESLLFLSMLPLHSDRVDRQLMMLAIGVERFDSILHQVGRETKEPDEYHHNDGR